MIQKKRHTATTIRLEEQDKEAIARIKDLYGCPSDSAAIRLALRMVARGDGILPQAPNKERPLNPPA
jgi:hypothetical protein